MIPLRSCFHRSACPVTLCTTINMVIKARCAHFCCRQQSTTVLSVFTVVTLSHSAALRESTVCTVASDKSKNTPVLLLDCHSHCDIRKENELNLQTIRFFLCTLIKIAYFYAFCWWKCYDHLNGAGDKDKLIRPAVQKWRTRGPYSGWKLSTSGDERRLKQKSLEASWWIEVNYILNKGETEVSNSLLWKGWELSAKTGLIYMCNSSVGLLNISTHASI